MEEENDDEETYPPPGPWRPKRRRPDNLRPNHLCQFCDNEKMPNHPIQNICYGCFQGWTADISSDISENNSEEEEFVPDDAN